jgi:spermidine/putrescine transport system substrate-binding protein
MRTYDRRGLLTAAAAAAGAYYGGKVSTAHAWSTGPKPSRTLHYYGWIDYVSPETYAAFTRATGIAVRKSYFTSNDALYARLAAGGTGFDLAVPTGYMVQQLAEAGLLGKIDWKLLPTVRKNIDPKFRGLPYDRQNAWSVPKDWGTTGFMYRTDKIKERPKSWAQFFALFKRYPRKFTLLDSSTEVVGSVAVMMGYSFNTDSPEQLARVERFLVDLVPYVHSFDSEGYAAKIARGAAFGGLGWNGDGAYVVSHSPKNAARYVVAREGGEFWVDAHVIPRGARNRAAAHAWIDFVYRPRVDAVETLYTYFGSPLRRSLFGNLLAPTVLQDRVLFPAPRTFAHLEASDLTPRGSAARKSIWAKIRGA